MNFDTTSLRFGEFFFKLGGVNTNVVKVQES